MSTATIAFALNVVALAVVIGAVFELRRRRKAGAPRQSVKRVHVAILVVSLVGLIALLVWTAAVPEPSGPNSGSVSTQLIVQLAGPVLFTAFTIWFAWWRIRKVRRMSEELGEPVLTRRAEAELNVEPALALQWAALAIRNLGAHGVQVNSEERHIDAWTPLHWDDVPYYVTADIAETSQGNSVVGLTAWPKRSEMASSDLGAVQYFVDQLMKDILSISENPPERETPANVMRRVLTDVTAMSEIEPSIRDQATAAIKVLDEGELREAEGLTNQVIDAIRFTYGRGDPARRVAQINLDRKISELGGLPDT